MYSPWFFVIILSSLKWAPLWPHHITWSIEDSSFFLLFSGAVKRKIVRPCWFSCSLVGWKCPLVTLEYDNRCWRLSMRFDTEPYYSWPSFFKWLIFQDLGPLHLRLPNSWIVNWGKSLDIQFLFSNQSLDCSNCFNNRQTGSVHYIPKLETGDFYSQ